MIHFDKANAAASFYSIGLKKSNEVRSEVVFLRYIKLRKRKKCEHWFIIIIYVYTTLYFKNNIT